MVTGTQSRERSEGAHQNGHHERLAMRQGDVPPPVPERVANPRVREDQAVQDFRQNSEKMHRATSENANTRAWFDCCRSVFPQSVRKAGPDVDLYNVSTYQCSILFNNIGFLQQEENIDKAISSSERFNVTNDPHLSLLTEFSGNNYAHVILTAEAGSLPTDAKELLHGFGLVGCHSSRSNDLPVHAGYIRLLWESDVDTRNGHAAIFDLVKDKQSN